MKKENRRFLIVFSVLFLAFYVLSIFAQDLAYFFHESIYTWHPLYYVTVFMSFAIAVYLIMYFAGVVLLIRKTVEPKVVTIFLIVVALAGIPRLLLNIFIVAMWWG